MRGDERILLSKAPSAQRADRVRSTVSQSTAGVPVFRNRQDKIFPAVTVVAGNQDVPIRSFAVRVALSFASHEWKSRTTATIRIGQEFFLYLLTFPSERQSKNLGGMSEKFSQER